MGKFQVMDHPLIQHKLTIIRNKNCGTKVFREVVNEITMLMAYDVARDMPLEDVEIETPIAKMTAKQLAGRKVAVVPILRAGIGMVDGFLQLIPAAKVGHIGMYRDEETLEPHEYFLKLPEDIGSRQVFVVDPMLATGGSAIMAIDALKKHGATNLKFVCLVAAPEGVKALQDKHPDLDIYTAALDDHLNEDGYIVPGLGDAGDRLFGTK
ncbi:uracil phosphoribosyltransferase [Secundilactobacillus kimchicus]|uniref:Uracil phosphoribosyltransferase n=1 Tax=Secundilactobacillus kimchicus JCM 15530 TaxID=1302272 RepID=A0A0R1HN32_9LACO|nr:uracil phosphoribosyltransferase [Secundilactobacillus kimchicus]KRK48221.1 uracil phosphoribosyltransferase [Secundilactobacillus kimchicus JCM 15530]MBT9670818.1 uracil phosphoribosyltransferase [Secundilactobacillus kimchicus]